MPNRASVLIAVILLTVSSAFAKDKSKTPLPSYVLHARTIAVLVDPSAGVSIDDPQANHVAQKDVEASLLRWGRFEPLLDAQTADLIIVVRKGHVHPVDDTISDSRQNSRAGGVNPTDNGVALGAQRGRTPGNLSSVPDAGSNTPDFPHPQTEIGDTDDSFLVFQGGVPNPLGNPPIWRYLTKDALHSHDVPAVDQFRKAIAETEKAEAKKQ
jgi:hypothetical protein